MLTGPADDAPDGDQTDGNTGHVREPAETDFDVLGSDTTGYRGQGSDASTGEI